MLSPALPATQRDSGFNTFWRRSLRPRERLRRHVHSNEADSNRPHYASARPSPSPRVGPVALSVQSVDGCGPARKHPGVLPSTFSSTFGDPPLALSPLEMTAGTWQATGRRRRNRVGQPVTSWDHHGDQQSAATDGHDSQVNGGLSSVHKNSMPAITQAGIVSAASPRIVHRAGAGRHNRDLRKSPGRQRHFSAGLSIPVTDNAGECLGHHLRVRLRRCYLSARAKSMRWCPSA